MNFATDVVDAAPPGRLALVAIGRDGERREWTFGEIGDGAARFAGALASRGVRRGDVVMTLIGNRVEWVLALVGCMRCGAVALPCTEQLRAHDLALRVHVARPALIVADERDTAELARALAGLGGEAPAVLTVPDATLLEHDPAPPAGTGDGDPALILFTSGTQGEPKAVVHGGRYVSGQAIQAGSWFAPREGELAWCTASSGWSKSTRNVFMAPWLRGAAALIHDGRFDPAERLAILERERVAALCMAPTEYRMIAARASIPPLPALRTMVAAGEALNPGVMREWHAATGVWIRDGYGQTETGALTGVPEHAAPRPGSMGPALPGVELSVADGELVLDPRSDPTFFLGYLDEDVCRNADGSWAVRDRRDGGPWRTGDLVEREADGWLHFVGRTDDVIVSAGYRIGPFEVESALVSHPAVAEAAAVAAPDAERGQIVRAVVVLAPGAPPASAALTRELQEHVRAQTAPYKYPRVVDFVSELPKTASGKIRRAALRS
ncbi:MAG TPA: AMP-binding protein [Solirubrobacteraceae bacterium]|nr:AMP-binding protein [Solirubrobacteraceae bacterium]